MVITGHQIGGTNEPPGCRRGELDELVVTPCHAPPRPDVRDKPSDQVMTSQARKKLRLFPINFPAPPAVLTFTEFVTCEKEDHDELSAKCGVRRNVPVC
jgi:hypothetical protein